MAGRSSIACCEPTSKQITLPLLLRQPKRICSEPNNRPAKRPPAAAARRRGAPRLRRRHQSTLFTHPAATLHVAGAFAALLR